MWAFLLTITARIYAHLQNERPLVYIISGLLILVPGGVGVRGDCLLLLCHCDAGTNVGQFNRDVTNVVG
jgi:uncharacterized membrane protein YjjB (DUF3815 family)